MIGLLRTAAILVAVSFAAGLSGSTAYAERADINAPHITTLALSDDGRYLAAASSRGWLTLWDLVSGKPDRSFKAHDDDIYVLRFVVGSKLLLSGSDDYTAKIWSVPGLKNMRTIETAGKVTGGDVSKDGQVLVLGVWDGTIQKWNVTSGALVKSVQGHFFGRVKVNIAPSGTQIISGGSDQMIHVRDLDSLTIAYSLKSGVQGNKAHLGSVYGIQFINENRGISLASRGGAVLNHLILWDLQNKRPIKTSSGTASLAGFSFTRDMTRFAYVEGGKQDYHAFIFDVNDWRETLNIDAGETLKDVVIGPAGRLAITGSDSGRIAFWDALNGRHLVTAWCRFDRSCGVETLDGQALSGAAAWQALSAALENLKPSVAQ